MFRFALLAVFSIACSGSEKSPTEPTGPTGPASRLDAGVASVVADGAVGAPLTEQQCRQFIRKMLVLGLEELRSDQPPEKVPTNDQIEVIFKQLTSDPETMKRCKGQPQWAFECAMAATTVTEAEACEANQGSLSPG